MSISLIFAWFKAAKHIRKSKVRRILSLDIICELWVGWRLHCLKSLGIRMKWNSTASNSNCRSVGGDSFVQSSIKLPTRTQFLCCRDRDPELLVGLLHRDGRKPGQSAEETRPPHSCSLQRHGDRKRWENALESTVRVKPCLIQLRSLKGYC